MSLSHTTLNGPTMTRILYLLLLGLLASCAVGPNYNPAKNKVASAFANSAQPGLATNDTVIAWWRGFNDAQLNDLVDHAIASNHDLRIATANLLEARALRRQTQFDLLPTINADAGYANNRFSRAATFNAPGVGRNQELYDAGFDATWELDFFGRVRRSVQAGTAEVQAAEANRRDALVSLISEVARNYFELRGAQNELGVARRNAENQRETLNITQARLDGGRGTELDVARARAQLNSTLASIPPLETAAARARHRLDVLTGREPTALLAELELSVPLPALPPLVSISNPEALLRRRFNGQVGLEANSFSGLAQSGSDTWSFGPRISWAALDLGHVRARIVAADARAEAALAAYQRTVLTTLEETEDALVGFGREQARRDFLVETVRASQTAATLARQRFDSGAADFLTVLDSERVLLEAQDQLAQSQTRSATALVAVYKALGGGWESEENARSSGASTGP